MNIKLEIFAGAVTDAINSTIKYADIDADKIVDTVAINALREIQAAVQNDNIEEDFDLVEEIVCIFEKYNINAGNRHDFG